MDIIKRSFLFMRLSLHLLKLSFLDPLHRKIVLRTLSYSKPAPSEEEIKNVVIIGASFAGYHCARRLATSLPPGYKLVVVEPHSHFHFTWVFPRFCVVGGHEAKAFIPYGPYLGGEDVQAQVEWVQGRVTEISRDAVTVQLVKGEGMTGDEIIPMRMPFNQLVIATGSVSKEESKTYTGGLPSRVAESGRTECVERMKDFQKRLQIAKRLVVVGGGAAGVELATDYASHFNIKDNTERKVVLVHSRHALMHRFGKRLQKAARDGTSRLGVKVILEDRVVGHPEGGQVTLRSGRKVECDFLVDCAGQYPASSLLSALLPDAITESGHIKVLSTLQVADESLPQIYACGDVADTQVPTPNGRSAIAQANVVADNIIAATWGRVPSYKFLPHWVDAAIKLTLGLDASVMHFGDDKAELLYDMKDKDPSLMVDNADRKSVV